MRNAVGILVLLVVCVGGVFAWNYVELQAPLNEAAEQDVRNEGVEVRAHFGRYVVPSEVVFDIQEIDGDNSQADVFRLLLQFAETQQHRDYSRLVLSHRGKPKFLLEGSYVRKLGREYGSQNPVFTMRTLPENLKTLDGRPAFQEWSGGLLGVATKQMEDFSEFHRQWYLDDLLESSQ